MRDTEKIPGRYGWSLIVGKGIFRGYDWWFANSLADKRRDVKRLAHEIVTYRSKYSEITRVVKWNIQ